MRILAAHDLGQRQVAITHPRQHPACSDSMLDDHGLLTHQSYSDVIKLTRQAGEGDKSFPCILVPRPVSCLFRKVVAEFLKKSVTAVHVFSSANRCSSLKVEINQFIDASNLLHSPCPGSISITFLNSPSASVGLHFPRFPRPIKKVQ